MECINEVINLCKAIGNKIPRWTQGAGSNISVKDPNQNTLFIKGSGLRLDEVKDLDKVAKIDLRHFRKEFEKFNDLELQTNSEDTYSDLIQFCGKLADTPIRGSMETGFHAILKFRYVMHIHSLVAIAIQDPRWKLEFNGLLKKLPSSISPHAKISSMMPGLTLSLAIKNHLDAKVIFLENHGVILSVDENPDLALRSFDEWEEKVLDEMNWNRKLLDEKNLKMRWKVLTPDVAVFEDKILDCTQTYVNSNEGDDSKEIVLKDYFLSDSLNTKEKNLKELFLASAILYNWNPEMKPLQRDFIKTVAQLPTENFRKG